MLTIFRILSCFVVTSVCLRPLKTQFFAVRQDQTTLLLLLSINLRQELYMNGFANS